MKLLLAEDEEGMSEALVDILTHFNYLVDTVDNGKDALDYALVDDYDGIILDIMMPQMDGIQVLSAIRKRGLKTPVLLLTAKGDIETKIMGLDTGADDYLVKPFIMEELLARIRAMLRRKGEFTPDIVDLGNIILDCSSFELSGPGGRETLSKLEFLMLEKLMRNPGLVLSSEALLEHVWGHETDVNIGVVWVYISYLRKRFSQVGANVRIRSKRNVGYTLEVRG